MPVGAVADAVVLSTQVDGVVLVLKAGKTNRDLAKRREMDTPRDRRFEAVDAGRFGKRREPPQLVRIVRARVDPRAAGAHSREKAVRAGDDLVDYRR